MCSSHRIMEIFMKKTALVGLLLVSLMLCACSQGSALTFNANWYKNTTLGKDLSGTQEILDYEVTFKQSSTASDAFRVEYDKGTYRTELKNAYLTLSDGSSQREGYIYTTRLDISGRYIVNGAVGETFHDYILSTVSFLPVDNALQPVSSEKEVYTTSAISTSPSSLDTASVTYHYSYTVRYDSALSNATAVYTDLLQEDAEPKTTEYDLTGNTTFLDNEQILFALRGLDMNSSASFRSINSVMSQVQDVSLGTPTITEETVNFEADGETVSGSVQAYSVSLTYDNSYSGSPQTLVYARRTDANNNTYRNVLLRMETSVLQSLGTLTYRLVKADFSDK